MASQLPQHPNRTHRLVIRTILGSSAVAALFAGHSAQAQTSVVSACSGVSLPRSVVTDILSPVITQIAAPTEGAVNSILGLPLLTGLLPQLSLNATGLLTQAASGAPITLQALNTGGTIVGPSDQCSATSDSITLNTPAGIGIGGNQITGLGANGAATFAGDVNAIAFGNNARAEAGATGSIALGSGARVTAANSIALGAGSLATRGALAGYAATGLAGAQNSAGEVSVGAPGALRQITNVAAGTAPSDAATVGQVDGVAAQVTALGSAAIQYDGAARDRATLAGAAGTTLANVAPGTVAAGSNEAVNGGQLFATNQAVGANTAAIGTIGAQVTANTGSIAALDATAVRYDGTDKAGVTFGGAAGTTLNNVAAGGLSATSTQAVNGSQLFATNTQVDANTAAIAGLGNGSAGPVRYASPGAPTVPNGGTVTDDVALVGASGGAVGLHNVRDGTVAAGSSDAVTGGQLFTTQQAVDSVTNTVTALDTRVTTAETRIIDNSTAITQLQGGLATTNTNVANIDARTTANTNAITTINNNLTGSTVVATQYSNPDTPTVSNGGTLTNDVTLIGANAAAPVALHNVAGGTVAAGSTDAVNGGQLAAVSATASNGAQYDRDAAGNRTNSLTLVGGNAGAPVTINNVAAGEVSAGSTQAVNGGQLYATQQVAQQAAALGANSVQYDPGQTTVTFGASGDTPVTLRNVGPGTAATDAVNVGQLQAGMQSSVAQSNTYTDTRIGALTASFDYDLRKVRKDIGAGTSAALAAAGLPQPSEPGRSMIALGGGTYRGQTAVALGVSTFLKDGHSMLRLGATYDSRGHNAANAGYGYQF